MNVILKNIFGTNVEKYNKISASMPMYLVDGREFYEVTICNISFILVKYVKVDRLNVSSLKKYEKKYFEYFNKNIVYGFSLISTTQRKSLLENKIAFVSENEQVFIPFLGVYFNKCQKDNAYREIEKFRPSTQLLALYILYSAENINYNKNELSKIIGQSPMTVTRAVRELKQVGLLEEEKKGNEIFISCRVDKDAFIALMKPYLINPVQDIIYIMNPGELPNTIVRAGEYSLSDRSMLGYPKCKEYALLKSNDFFANVEVVDPNLIVNGEIIKIQKWKYSPFLLSREGMIDPISMICSFQDEEDERIQMSLDEVRGEVKKWQLMKS